MKLLLLLQQFRRNCGITMKLLLQQFRRNCGILINMKYRESFTTVLIMIVTVMFGTFTGILSLASLFYFNHYPLDFIESFVDTFPDSPVINILIILLVILITTALAFLFQKIKIKDWVLHVITGVISTISLGFLLFFVYKAKCVPVCDQMQLVLDAIFFKNGNYEDMRGYLNTFQQQYGLVFLEEMIMRIKEDYHIFQYINAVFVAGSMYAIFPITKLLSGQGKTAFFGFLAAVSFVPLYYYANFVYGEVPSLAFATFGIWMLLLFLKKGEGRRFVNRKNWFFLLLIIPLFTLSYVSRTNLVILLIALVCALILYGIRKNKWGTFILAAVIIILPLLANSGIKKSYELRSGIEIGAAQPALGWIAMGMQVSEQGYGFCNDYANNTFNTTAEGNRDVANEIYKEEIAYRIQEFKTEPRSAYVFYRMKMLQQWNEGTFGSIVHTNAFEDGVPGRTIGKFFSNVYGQYVNMFCNRYVAVIYFLYFVFGVTSVVYMILKFIRNSKNNKTENMKESEENVKDINDNETDSAFGGNFAYLFMIYFIGGFLFSLLWEAKPRYVFPYVYLCLPLAAVGLSRIQGRILWLIEACFKTKKKETANTEE